MTRKTLLAAACALALAPAAQAAIVAYPSAQTIYPTGPLPPGGAAQVTLDVAVGETEDAQILVTGARNVAAAVDGKPLEPLVTQLMFGHYVSFGARKIPDALLPWDGRAHATEEANQPLWIQVGVPAGTPPGTYTSKIVVNVDGKETNVPITVRVFPLTIPPFTQANGNLLAAFHLSAESYVSKVGDIYNMDNPQRIAANAALFKFLAQHRVSPLSWGFGEPGPKAAQGYDRNAKWWLDSAGNMEREQQESGGFPAMRIPISNNRTAPGNYIGGQDPNRPEGWCDYLRSVHDFWSSHGWFAGGMALLYGLDEPGPAGQRLVGRQAAVAHRCFAGSRVLMTGNPTAANRFLWDNRDGNDVDVWTVLTRRYYGTFSTPRGARRAHRNLGWIAQARAKGKTIWSYTYSGVPGTPGLAATEPLSNPRVLFLWNALEGITGLLYGQGTTNFGPGDPLVSVAQQGEYVLLYPGRSAPTTSARLEQVRDGVEDWAIYNAVRKRRGAGAVRAILGRNGVFSASSSKVALGCTASCDFKAPTKYSWPRWSHDASTPKRIEAAKLQALEAATG